MAEALRSAPPEAVEVTDVNVRAVVLIGAALGGIVVICAIAVFGLTAWLADGQRRPAGPITTSPALQQFALPHLQAAPANELAAFKREKALKLQQYAWIDRERGVVQIPIERAIDLLLQREAPGSSHEDR